jgi:KDO2-lipid IV(A) lauroyltransferase
MARTKFQNYIEFCGLKVIMIFIYFFPMRVALKIADFLALLMYHFIPFRKSHVKKELTLSFPNKTSQEIEIIIKKLYKNFAKTVVGIMFMPKLKENKIKDMMIIDEDLLKKTFEQGKGAVMMSAHFGNWELTAVSLAKRYPVSVIVADQSNHIVDEMMNNIRTKNGCNIISRDDKFSTRKVLKALKNNEFVAILADQDESKNGVYVPFFGRMCSMPRGAALFALRARCPLLTGFGIYHKDGTMEVELKEIVLPNTGDIHKDVEKVCLTYCQHLEQAVTRYPEQWLWFHKKWKTRPKASRWGH